jgi:adenosylhomocysteine nucleosidase
MIVHFSGELPVMTIGIITAMPEEFRAVADSLGAAAATQPGTFRAVRLSSYGHEFLLVESGMGFGNAARAAESLVRDERPDLLISTGFCGGIAPELQAGDVVVADNIIIAGETGFEEIPVPFSSIGAIFVASQAAAGKRVVAGAFVSSPAIMSKRRVAGMLSGRFQNPVADMESGAIAAIAAENGIPLLAIRAVSDSAAEELGFSLDEFCDSGMRRILPYKVLLTALRKPGIIPQLVHLSCSSRRAAESIKAAFSRLFPLL